MNFYPSLEDTVNRLANTDLPVQRQEVIQPLIDYLLQKFSADATAHLNFICTHNSRRSQMAQVWAHTAARWYKLKAKTYSGGVEVTAFNINALDALSKAGFIVQILDDKKANPTSFIKVNETDHPLATFSKLYDHENNPKENFAAIMTCSEADENCPYIPGAEQRIPLLYEDPKLFDNTAQQAMKYLERSEQIGSELLYAFGKVKSKLS